MQKKYAVLQHVIENQAITMGSDGEFVFHLQRALLLGLKEQGRLNELQYRYAIDKLNYQQLVCAKKRPEEGKRRE